MRTKLVAFAGKAGSGKSTAVRLLRESLPYGVENIKFAEPLYRIQEFIYGTISPVYRRPEGFTKDRKLLQWIGTEWGRDTISESLWLDLWVAETTAAQKHRPYSTVTVDDLRYDNEAEPVKSLGGVIIRIDSSFADARNAAKDGIAGHKTEAGVDSKYIDLVVRNDGSLDDYKDALTKAYSELKLI